MWRVALRDLQWRRRRFVIAVLATSLVFGMTLLMAGFATSLHHEGRRIVAALGADAWLVAAGAPGPFTTSTPIPAAEADRVAAMPGPLFGLRRSATARAVGHAVLTGYTPGDFRELVGSGVGLPPARWARTPPCPEGPDGAK